MKFPRFLWTGLSLCSASVLSAQTLYVPGGASAIVNSTGIIAIAGSGGGAVDFTVNGRILSGDATNNGGVWLNSAQTAFIGMEGNSTIGLYNGASGWAVSILQNGNVGIGTTNPYGQMEIYKMLPTSASLQPMLTLTSDFGSAAGTGFGSSLVFRGRTAGNIMQENAQIAAYNENGSDNGYALGFFTRPSAGAGLIQNLTILRGGNVGIGTITPSELLHLFGAAPNLLIEGSGITKAGVQIKTNGYVRWDINSPSASSDLRFNNGSSDIVTVQNAGNVGIGTTNPTQKLSVNGTIRAKEVIVDTGWSDYVFADDYRLAPLSEIETQIKADRHLPGIPSAQEVADHGVSLGEMQAKLLAKMEELTLHMIALKKENDALKSRVGVLESK